MRLRLSVILALFFLVGINGFCQTQGPVFDHDPSNEKFKEWVIEHTDWSCLNESGCCGRIIVSFKVDRDGNLVNPTISRGLEPLVDAAVLQAVSSSPKWEPAKKNNRAVSSKQQVEIIVMPGQGFSDVGRDSQ